MNPVIGIVGGEGQMGRLFANFLKQKGIDVLISDIKTKLTNKDLAKKSDIVIISVPIEKTEKVIKEILPFLKPSQAIMDLTSIKNIPVKTMLTGECEVLGMHPMFGATNAISGQTIILCPTKKSGKWSKWMKDFLLKNDVQIEELNFKDHDKIMGLTQGLVHFADITFIDALKEAKMPIEKVVKFASKASELKVLLASRLIAQDPSLYANIQILSPEPIKYLERYKKSVERLIKIVKNKDFKGFSKYFLNNKKYLKSYAEKGLNSTSYLIARLIQDQNLQHGKKEIPTKNHIAILGPTKTFSDIAATEYLTENKLNLKKYLARNIDEVFELVEKGKVNSGFIPIENKLGGTVRESMDNLFSKNVHIIDGKNIKIHLCLIGLQNSKKSLIKKIYSHEQALNQCKNYIKKNFPSAEKTAWFSTSSAVYELYHEKKNDIAAIGSYKSAEFNGLKILDKNIEDIKNNETSFIVIEKGTFKNSNLRPLANKISIAFYFSKDKPGSLFSVFKEFADSKINLTKIESRPTGKEFGDYIFYLDFEGNLQNPKIQKVLKSIEQKTAKLKILGNY